VAFCAGVRDKLPRILTRRRRAAACAASTSPSHYQRFTCRASSLFHQSCEHAEPVRELPNLRRRGIDDYRLAIKKTQRLRSFSSRTARTIPCHRVAV
jgi:hypothetical protein